MPTRWTDRLTSLRKRAPDPLFGAGAHDDTEVAAMLRELGVALVEVNQATQLVAARLLTVAHRYTTHRVRVVVLPTVLVIQVGTVGYEVEATTHATTQLDLAGRIDAIAELAEAGAITPTDAIKALAAARQMKPRFGRFVTVIGYILTTVGFGMIINPTWAALAAYVFLGAVVGVIVIAAQPFPALSPIVPTAAAMVVTLLAIWFVADAANDGLLRVISPALVAVLPGLSLTIGAMELASSAIIAGTSRLVYGVTELGLMVFGVALGMHIAGNVAPQPPSPRMGEWSLYAAIFVIAIGLYIYLSAPRGSLGWLTAAIGVALIGQQLGGLFMSDSHSGAVGAFLVVPFAMLATRIKSAPPAVVMMLAAFWALVPGALTFRSLGEAAAGHITDANDITTLGASVAAIFSIALGTLIGFSVVSAIDARLPGRRSG